MVLYDAVVVGGGVVGAAVAREMQSSGLSVLLCEKEAEWLSGASSGNTGHLGSNFYYTADRAPLEAILTAKAREINPGWLAGQPNVPWRKDGMVYLARGREEDEALVHLVRLARQNGQTSVRLVDLLELASLEPELDTTGVTSALFSSEEYIVDSWLLSMTHIYGCVKSGVEMLLECEVVGTHRDNHIWTVHTTRGQFKGKMIVNCAGILAELVDELSENKVVPDYEMTAGKGEYIILEGKSKVYRPVVPVPTKKTAGVYIFTSVSGHTVVGPTNIPQRSRTDKCVSEESKKMLKNHVNAFYPCTTNQALLGVYCGLRPATQHQDYCLNIQQHIGWITIAGIRSTGLTASLALSQYVCSKLLPGYKPSEVPELPTPVLEGTRVRIGEESYLPTHPLSNLLLTGRL